MDLGVVACPQKRRSLEIIPFADQELGLVCTPTHRLARRRRIRPGELAGEKFVAFEEKIPTRVCIDRILRSHGVAVDVAMEFDNIETLKRAVEVDAGLSILPLDNVTREVAAGLLAYVRFGDRKKWVRRVGIIRRAGKAATPAERALLELLSRRT
jgi:DNA-binding transcriptional LysR family regulator